MIDELNRALEAYRAKWQKMIATRKNIVFFQELKPTAAAWKVIDLNDFDKRFTALRDACDQIHLGWVNERWLGTLHLKETKLVWNIEIAKLFQRRPQSKDPVGLDHVDFLMPGVDYETAKRALTNEAELKWTEETNGKHCKWLSIWFDGTEAKLREDTVLQVCADELLECQTHVRS